MCGGLHLDKLVAPMTFYHAVFVLDSFGDRSCRNIRHPARLNQKMMSQKDNTKIMIMTAITNESNSMLNQVMASMRIDDISLVARNDPLIKKVGMVLIEKHGTKNIQDTFQKTRTFSFINTTKKNDDNPNAKLFDFIKLSKFDVVIEAVKMLCHFETKDGQQDVQIPSLALKIGHSLNKCVNVVRFTTFVIDS